jgi:hypothetical protein
VRLPSAADDHAIGSANRSVHCLHATEFVPITRHRRMSTRSRPQANACHNRTPQRGRQPLAELPPTASALVWVPPYGSRVAAGE